MSGVLQLPYLTCFLYQLRFDNLQATHFLGYFTLTCYLIWLIKEEKEKIIVNLNNVLIEFMQ